jgi:hypothetical protein
MTAGALAGLPPSRGTGVASVTSIRPPQTTSVPIASTQGTLALEFGTTPPRPRLRAVAGRRRELDAFASRFSAAVLEVIGGDRGPQQLLHWTSDRVYADLVRRSRALNAAAGSDQRLRRLRAQVRSVHLFCPTEHSAELSVHVRHGQRSRAIAARLEHLDGRWICTDLQFG